MNISKTNGSIATKFYLKHHLGGGLTALGFGPERIRTLVSMATESSHRVIMVKTVSPLFMPPTLKKWGRILVSACPYVCMYVCMYSCSRYLLETSCMDSSWKNSRRIFLVFPELSPLVKLRPFDKQGDEIL